MRLGRGLAAVLGREVHLHGFGVALMDALAPNRELFDRYAAWRRERGIRFALCTNNVREWEPLWRVRGLVRHWRGHAEWGAMERGGFRAATPRARP